MEVLTPHLITDKNVLLRIDMDVPIKNGQVTDDFRLRAMLPTLYLCLQYANKVTVMGHIGRPGGREVPELSVKPIVEWLDVEVPEYDFPRDRLLVLENLRFESGEDACDLGYAKELASLGNFYVNEAFAAHHPAASTTVLPALLPSACGFHFNHEIRELSQIRRSGTRPLIGVIGGAKIEDKLPVVTKLSEIADKVLVGGKLPAEIKEKGINLPENVLVARMTESGFDLHEESVGQFADILKNAKEIAWSGPMGKYEDGFTKGSKAVSDAIISSEGRSIIGGGDTIDCLKTLGVLGQFYFVSTGGGAMLRFLVDGTLPTIEAMK